MNDLKDWAVADCLWTAQAALEEVCNNMPARFVGRLLRFLIFPLGRPWRRPSDGLENRLAQVVSVASSGRDRLTAGIYLPMDPAEPLSRLETALRKVTNTSPLAGLGLRVNEASPAPGAGSACWAGSIRVPIAKSKR